MKKKRKRLFQLVARMSDGKLKAPCHYCGNLYVFKHFTNDHVLRNREGGSNHIENLVLSCKLCNIVREGPPRLEVLNLYRQLLGVDGMRKPRTTSRQ